MAGGGTEDQDLPVLSAFLEEIDSPQILYIPLALDPEGVMFKDSKRWAERTINKASCGKKVDVHMTLNSNDAHRNNFNGIFIGGGNTYRLAHLLRETGLDKVIIEGYQSGIPIYGGSAGALVCGKNLSLAKSERENYTQISGLNLLKGISCCCHYEDQDKNKIKKYLSTEKGAVIALRETAGVIVGPVSISSCNVDPAIIFSSGREYYLNAGDNLLLSEII